MSGSASASVWFEFERRDERTSTEEASALEPREFEQVQREERDAQLRLAAAREQARMSDGEAPTEHHELIHKLEAEWKRARERLEQARHHGKD
jgi:hypothetical protein